MLPELLDPDSAVAPFLLTTNTLPGKISVVSKLFHFIKSFNEILYLEAIPLKVSPLLTVYVFEFLAGCEGFVLELDSAFVPELDFFSVLMTWLGWMMSPDKLLIDFNCQTV